MRTSHDTEYVKSTPLTALQVEILQAIESHAGEDPFRVHISAMRRMARKTDLSRRIVKQPTDILPNAFIGVTNVLRIAQGRHNTLVPQETRDKTLNIEVLEVSSDGKLKPGTREFDRIDTSEAIVFDECCLDSRSRELVSAIARTWPKKPMVVICTLPSDYDGPLDGFSYAQFQLSCSESTSETKP